MSLKERLRLKLNPAFYWRMAFWACLGTVLIMTVLLWFRAAQETEDALNSGRRIIIRLSDGAFERALPPEEAPPPEEMPAPGADPETPAPDPAHPAQDPAGAAAAGPDAGADTAGAPPEPPLTPTARIPLNPVKEALREKSSAGILPVIAADGTRPWRHYAKPYTLKGNHPMIAVAVTGLGQNRKVAAGAIHLPENISLSFSPYAKDVETWSNSARATGHEVLLDLPLEPTNYPASDPGPYSLMTDKSAEENTARLQWLLGRAQGYIGFATPHNEAYSLSDAHFKLTLELLNARGLMLFMPHEPVRKETKQVLDNSKTAYTLADMVLDEELSSEAIQARLTALEKTATRRGYAIGYARGIPLTLRELAAWSAKLEERGFTLVPLTYITSRKFK